MAPAAAFATVLDEYLDHPPTRDTAAAGRPPIGVATRSLFWFEGASAVAARPVAARPVPEPLRLVKPAQSSVRRVARVLSPAQRQALDQMIGLGARLDDTFTRQELRSEFRALARLYHPDRLQVVAGTSAARNGSRFVALRRAYDVLKKAA